MQAAGLMPSPYHNFILDNNKESLDLTESTAHAAVGAELVAVVLGEGGAVVVGVGAGVGGVRRHAVTQAAALGGPDIGKNTVMMV